MTPQFANVEFTLNGEPLRGVVGVDYAFDADPPRASWRCEAAVELLYTDGGRGYRRLWEHMERARKAFEATQRGCAEGAARFWARYARGLR